MPYREDLPPSYERTGRTKRSWKKKSPWRIKYTEEEWPSTDRETKEITFSGALEQLYILSSIVY